MNRELVNYGNPFRWSIRWRKARVADDQSHGSWIIESWLYINMCTDFLYVFYDSHVRCADPAGTTHPSVTAGGLEVLNMTGLYINRSRMENARIVLRGSNFCLETLQPGCQTSDFYTELRWHIHKCFRDVFPIQTNVQISSTVQNLKNSPSSFLSIFPLWI